MPDTHGKSLTWGDCAPAETPASLQSLSISVEEDLHAVCLRCYDWRIEVLRSRRIIMGVTAASIHQDGPVPINDLEVMTWAQGDVATSLNSKVSELKPQHFPSFHLKYFSLVKIRRIYFRVVR